MSDTGVSQVPARQNRYKTAEVLQQKPQNTSTPAVLRNYDIYFVSLKPATSIVLLNPD